MQIIRQSQLVLALALALPCVACGGPPQPPPPPPDTLDNVAWETVVSSPDEECQPEILRVDRGDLNGDDAREALVSWTCGAVTSGYPDVVDIYDGASRQGEPRIVGRALDERSSGEERGSRVVNVVAGDGRATIRANEYRPDDSNADPSVTVEYDVVVEADRPVVTRRVV